MSSSVYLAQQDAVLKNLQGVPRLLLHSCCGPCSSACLELLSRYFFVTVFWYNPNLYPDEEYTRRLETQKKLLKVLQTDHPVSLLEAPYDKERFYQVCAGLEKEKEGGVRCTQCFFLRLEACAKAAKEGGFDFFTTTLTVSPHKDAPQINELGQALSRQYDVAFLPCDFKKRNGYQRSIALSKEYALYRQTYCGCVFSLRESPDIT